MPQIINTNIASLNAQRVQSEIRPPEKLFSSFPVPEAALRPESCAPGRRGAQRLRYWCRAHLGLEAL